VHWEWQTTIRTIWEESKRGGLNTNTTPNHTRD